MKHFVLAVAAVILSLSVTIGEAEAARLGGSKSFGMSRSSGTVRQTTPSTPAQNAASAPAPAVAPVPATRPAGMSRWLGPMAGLAAGIGLAAMLSHFGMGEGAANFMMLALLAMAALFLLRWLFRPREPAARLQYAGAGAVPPMAYEAAKVGGETGVSRSTAAVPALATGIPADFDTQGFLRQAKLNFVRMQAANDRGDLDDIRQFTAPEVFAEIQLQIQERAHLTKHAPQQTDVVRLDAELLELCTEDNRHIASVRYFGQLREEAHAAPQDFAEVWHLSKPTDGSRGWQIAGIQQVH